MPAASARPATPGRLEANTTPPMPASLRKSRFVTLATITISLRMPLHLSVREPPGPAGAGGSRLPSTAPLSTLRSPEKFPCSQNRVRGNNPNTGRVLRGIGDGKGMPGDSKRARFEREVLPHLDAGYNLARWLLRNPEDAEDATQDA